MTFRRHLVLSQPCTRSSGQLLRHRFRRRRRRGRVRGRELRAAGRPDAALARHLVRLDAAALAAGPALLDRLDLATSTCQWWANGRFWAWEGVGCCHGTCTHVWNYEHAMARLFPRLERSRPRDAGLRPRGRVRSRRRA